LALYHGATKLIAMPHVSLWNQHLRLEAETIPTTRRGAVHVIVCMHETVCIHHDTDTTSLCHTFVPGIEMNV
jgi:hypothetical protein